MASPNKTDLHFLFRYCTSRNFLSTVQTSKLWNIMYTYLHTGKVRNIIFFATNLNCISLLIILLKHEFLVKM